MVRRPRRPAGSESAWLKRPGFSAGTAALLQARLAGTFIDKSEKPRVAAYMSRQNDSHGTHQEHVHHRQCCRQHEVPY